MSSLLQVLLSLVGTALVLALAAQSQREGKSSRAAGTQPQTVEETL
jgi:hypothetical protein